MAAVAGVGAGAPAEAASAARGRAARIADALLAPIVGVCAAGPIIASTARALSSGWLPAGDQANIAVRAWDVLGPRSSLLGLHSDLSELTHHSIYSLGPMLFWLLALPVRISDSWSLVLAMGLLNVVCVAFCVVLARRRGGIALMGLCALALVVMQRSLATELLHDIWNPAAGLMPFSVLIFLCWGLACGEHRLLPATVLAASFAAQCQLSFAVPSLALCAIGALGLALSLRGRRRAARGEEGVEPDGVAAAARGRVWPWALAALVLAAACWAPPAVDQLRGRPGNITELLRAERANHSTLGAGAGRSAVVRAVGVPPWWTSDPASPWEHKNEVRETPAHSAQRSALLVLVALAALVLAGALRREARTWSAGAIGLALCACIAAVASSTPTMRVLAATLGYTLWWASAAGMFVWLVLLWSALRLIAAIPPLHRALAGGGRRHGRARALAGIACVAATALAALSVASGQRPDEHLAEYRPLAAFYRALQRVPRGATVRLIGGLGESTFRFKMAARLALVRHGVHPVSPGTDTRLGQWYELDHRPYRCTVYVQDGSRPPARGVQRLAAAPYAGRTVSVWLSPAGCPLRPPPRR